MNSPKLSTIPNTLENLKSNITKACNEIKDSLIMTPPQAINYYGITTAKKLDSEFVDVIVVKLLTLRTHLQELKKYIAHNDLSQQELTELFTGCNDVVATVVNVSKKDHSFFELLDMPYLEIKTLV